MYENDPIGFWKNFRLGTELHISGSMIYNALYSFDHIEYFRYEHEVFDFLYNVAIGLERLQKIAIILIEHDELMQLMEQEEFERTLITHNHIDLHNRISKHRPLSIGKQHMKLLQLISDFYRSTRYSRLNLSSVYSKNQDLHRLLEFLKKELGVTEEEGIVDLVANTTRVKRFVGNLIGKLTTELYRIIRNDAGRLNLFTYEILPYSKCYKIFLAEEFTFEKERHMQKEILVLLQSGQLKDGSTHFIKGIKPLPLQDYNSTAYLRYLMDIRNNSEILDEMDAILNDNPISKERREQIDVIGNKHVHFSVDEDEFENDWE